MKNRVVLSGLVLCVFVLLFMFQNVLADESLYIDEEIHNEFDYSIMGNGNICINAYLGDEEDVVIPNIIDGRKVSHIAREAFFNKNVKRVEIQENITFIEDGAFSMCPNITFYVSPENDNIATLDGILFSKEDKRLICFPSDYSRTYYSVPDGVKAIAYDSFSSNKNINSVRLPSSLENVRDGAFVNSSITEVSVASEHPAYEVIGDTLIDKRTGTIDFFFSDSENVDYIIPETIKTVAPYAFFGHQGLKSVVFLNEDVAIGKYAFAGCTDLTFVSLPGKMNKVNAGAFMACKNLKSIVLPGQLVTIDNRAFEACTNLSEIYMPNTLQSIGDKAFKSCISLRKIRIPANIINIGQEAFSKSGLTTVSYLDSKDSNGGGLDSVRKDTFSGCNMLTDVRLSKSITSLEKGAFEDCVSLKNMVIPSNVIDIKPDTFNGCKDIQLTVTRDSFAANYCKEYGFDYVYDDADSWLVDDISTEETTTVMIYMDAEKLEPDKGAATADLIEMANASTDTANIIVYTGGCPNWQNSVISNDKNQIYQVEEGGIRCLVEEAGTASLDDPSTLASFIKWSCDNYPSDHYNLVLWGIDFSITGIQEKSTDNIDGMKISLDEVSDALDAGGAYFDLIIADSSYMASYENALVLSQYADFYIASETEVLEERLYYTDWLTELSKNPTLSPYETGEIISDGYDAKTIDSKGELSVIDLQKFRMTVPAALSTMLNNLLYTKISLHNNEFFSKEYCEQFRIGADALPLDLYSYAQSLENNYGSAVEEAVTKSCDVYSKNDSSWKGLSIYFPFDEDLLNESQNISEDAGLIYYYSLLNKEADAFICTS